MFQGRAFQIGDDLLDDGVVPVLAFGGQRRCGGIGEHCVEPVHGEQFPLALRSGFRVQPFHPTHDQPRGDLVGLGGGGERCWPKPWGCAADMAERLAAHRVERVAYRRVLKVVDRHLDTMVPEELVIRPGPDGETALELLERILGARQVA